LKDLWNSQEVMENVGLWIAVYEMKKCEWCLLCVVRCITCCLMWEWIKVSLMSREWDVLVRLEEMVCSLRARDANTLHSIRAADRAYALQWMVATRDLLATHLECCKKRNL
jgi:hypothetical protein